MDIIEEIEEEKTEGFLIHASVPENWRDVSVWGWDYKSGKDASKVWPGITLKKDEDGWFTAELPAFVNSIILCGNRGAIQSSKVSFTSREIWVIVTGDLRCDLSYCVPDLISVYAKVPVFWRNPHLWAWNERGKNAFYSWPGGLMVQEGDYYKLSAPAWIDHIIINGKDGFLKTEDIAVEKGKDIYINVNRQGDYSIDYKKMSSAPQESAPEIVPLEVKTEESILDSIPENKDNKASRLKKAALIAAAAISLCAAAILSFKKKHKI